MKNIIQDVDVVNQFNTGRDHRMGRWKVLITTKINRKRKLGQTTRGGSRSYKAESFKHTNVFARKKKFQIPSKTEEHLDEGNRKLQKL